MKQIKSSKNQPRWTKTMSILSLSVAVQTQACAGTKVEMFSGAKEKSAAGTREQATQPVNLAALSRNTGSRSDKAAYDQYLKDLNGLGLKPEAVDTITEAEIKGIVGQNNDTLLHRVALHSKSRLTLERIWMRILRLFSDKNLIRLLVLQPNRQGDSVLAVAAQAGECETFYRFLTCTKEYLEPRDFTQIKEELDSLQRAARITADRAGICKNLLPSEKLPSAVKENQSERRPSAPLLSPPPPPLFPPTTQPGAMAGKPQGGPPLDPRFDLNAELLALFRNREAGKSVEPIYDTHPLNPRPIESGILQKMIRETVSRSRLRQTHRRQ